MSRAKGNRREREACAIYEATGFRTERAVQAHYGTRSDFFGLFDVMAIHPTGAFHFAQVKSNRAEGIREWMVEAQALVPDWVTLDFLVCTDGKGWRLMRPHDGDTDGSYRTVCDERDIDCNMGDALEAALRSDVATWSTGSMFPDDDPGGSGT